MINNFQGNYSFLSTFYDKLITYDGITYKNAESAFQAQKTDSESLRKKFSRLLPTEAYRRGQKILLRSDWEEVKEKIMYEINKIKFSDENLKKQLLATGKEELINGNNSGDKIWGVYDGQGENKLGKILMQVRKEIQDGECSEPTQSEKKSKKSKSEEQSSDL